MTSPTAATRLIALLGDPVAHSLSPRFQNAAIRAAGLDARYLALRCDAADLDGLLRGIARARGAGNVTVPHKQRTVPLLDEVTPAVAHTGACNTFWGEGDAIHGDNTDVAGFAAAARSLIGAPGGARVLLLGAGGAARAALYALLEDGVGRVDVLNRTRERAAALRHAFDPEGDRVRVVEDRGALRHEDVDLVVNATSLGLHADDAVPLDLDAVNRIGAALDLVYGEHETRWIREARARGVPAADGLEMLIRQGAAAFERWFGRPAPLQAMRDAVPRSGRPRAAAEPGSSG